MSDPIIQDIKDRIDLVDYIGGFIQLKKAGANFKGLCPFHNERTPSFNVSQTRQIWHCFGCGEGGDIFEFAKKIENLDFKETLKILAQKAGVILPEFRSQTPQKQQEKEFLLRIIDFASRLYNKTLLNNSLGSKAMEYLKVRGLNEKTIEKWKIGFAPNEFHFLENSLIQKNIDIKMAVTAGVCVKNETGKIYDRFRGRITFPIFNYFGDAIGFSARILPEYDDGKSGKYINSPESILYSKSKEIFGLFFAKESIRKNNEVVVVEGQMDCISAHQAGFENTIATSGTALTLEQLNILGRLTKNIKFCFDSDMAGLKASRKAGEIALKQGFRVKVVDIGKAKDPDELIKKSSGLWEKAVSQADWFLDYYIKKAKEKFPNDLIEQKRFLSEEVVSFLPFIQDVLEQDHYINQLVKDYGISEKVLRQKAFEKTNKVNVNQQTDLITQKLKPSFVLEKEVFGGILLSLDFYEKVKNDLESTDFENPDIAKEIEELKDKTGVIFKQKSALAQEAVFMVEFIKQELDNTAFLKRLLKAFGQLKVEGLKKKQKALQNQIMLSESGGDRELVKKIQQDFLIVSQKKIFWEKMYN